jgi:hypothetical protein
LENEYWKLKSGKIRKTETENWKMTNEKSEQVFVFHPLSLEVDFVTVSDVINFPRGRTRQKFSIFKIS